MILRTARLRGGPSRISTEGVSPGPLSVLDKHRLMTDDRSLSAEDADRAFGKTNQRPPLLRHEPAPHSRPTTFARFLGLALLTFGLLGLATANVQAGTTGAVHRCKCGVACRGASCCCGPNGHVSTSAPAPAARPQPVAAVPARDTWGPCFGLAPCGGPEGLPSGPTFDRVWKLAGRVSVLWLRQTTDRLVLFPSPCLLPSVLADRLDRPPKPVTAD